MDQFMAIVTNWSLWLPILIPIALIAVWKGGFRVRAAVLCCGLVLGVGDGIVTQFGKKMVNRPRPHENALTARHVSLQHAKPQILAAFKPPYVEKKLNFFPRQTGRSFPSGHVMNNVMVATVMLLFFPRVGLIFLGIAVAVSYSRIYVGVHWPSDVVFSTLLGVGLALFLVACFEGLWVKFSPLLFPKLAAKYPSLFSKKTLTAPPSQSA